MSRKQSFRQVPAREVEPGMRLFDGTVVDMVARSGNDDTVAVWVDGVVRRLWAERTLPVVTA